MKITNTTGKRLKVYLHDGYDIEPIATLTMDNHETTELPSVTNHIEISGFYISAQKKDNGILLMELMGDK